MAVISGCFWPPAVAHSKMSLLAPVVVTLVVTLWTPMKSLHVF
jgi:hypothetical protein